MAVVRDLRDAENDRLAQDRQRHEELIKEALRASPETFEAVIAEESIITSGIDRKVRIPIRSKREPVFAFGFAPQGAAQQPGASRGQLLQDPSAQGAGAGQGQGQQGQGRERGLAGAQAGKDPGEELFGENELSVSDILDLLLEQFTLPNLEEKGSGSLKTSSRRKPEGKRKHGPWSRLNRRATVRQHLARKIASGKKPDEALPYREEDLYFFGTRETKEPIVNAVFFIVMDTSGSMDVMKRFLARVLCFLIAKHLQRRYRDVKVVFISHDTKAYDREEDDFFRKEASGGTKISSGMERVLHYIQEIYHPDQWNIYVGHCTDGENDGTDNPRMRERARQILEASNLFAFFEIRSNSTLATELSSLLQEFPHFVFEIVKERKDVQRAINAIVERDQLRVEAV